MPSSKHIFLQHLELKVCTKSVVLMGFPCGSAGKESACNAGNLGLIPGSRRSPGEGKDYPLQYSCLGNPMDSGAWRATYSLSGRKGWDTTEPVCTHVWWGSWQGWGGPPLLRRLFPGTGHAACVCISHPLARSRWQPWLRPSPWISLLNPMSYRPSDTGRCQVLDGSRGCSRDQDVWSSTRCSLAGWWRRGETALPLASFSHL